MRPVVIGVDIGGTKIAAQLGDGTLWNTAACTRPTPQAARPGVLAGVTPGSARHRQILAEGRAALLDTVITMGQELLRHAEQHGMQVRAVGIGTAGQVDSQRGVVLDANENLVGWKGTRLAEAVGAALGLPVYVENDVRALALAETTLGAGRDYRDVLFVAVGTGIGGALVLDGDIWHGAHYSAGEIGYLSAGDGQTIEGRYAGPAVAARFSAEQGLTQPLTLVEIAGRAQEGDAACARAIQQAAAELGRFIAPVLGFVDPQALVVGGGVPQIGPLWWDAFTDAVHSFRLTSVQQTPVLKAQLGPDAGRIGAALLAAQQIGLNG